MARPITRKPKADEQPDAGAAADRTDTFASILERRISRRAMLQGTAGGATALALTSTLGPLSLRMPEASAGQLGIRFTPISLDDHDQILVAAGYDSQLVVAWGDSLQAGVPHLDPSHQTAALQNAQFGYNADGLFFFPLPAGSSSSSRGIIGVNHEYTNPELMFPGYDPKAPTREQVDIELAAHGLAFVEVNRAASGEWTYDQASPYNRRVTGETEMIVTGPAARHPRLRTSADPTGQVVWGTLNNCSVGRTPWGTILTCEENFHQYFGNLAGLPASDDRAAIHRRYGLPNGASERLWEAHYDRFDIAKEPNEPFRFGWVVEIDPYDPSFTPRKRTALGRFRHEAATLALTTDGRAAVYSGDDERFEYVYKFVSTGAYNSSDRLANLELLDDGILYVASFSDDGTGTWIPLVFGQNGLGPENGFSSPADILIETRRAASLVGATPMDRPEDIEPNPVNGKIYAAMTNNNQRTPERVDGANPRSNNIHGHIIEITEGLNDPASSWFNWDILLLCGNPAVADDAVFAAGFDPSMVSAISSPDNINFDNAGNLWIATDGQINTFRMNDGIYVVPVEGPERGYVRQLVSGVPGGETSSLEFTPDNTTLFVCIQHPGEGSTYDSPTSLFPDGHTPPRPGIIAVTRTAPGPTTIGL